MNISALSVAKKVFDIEAEQIKNLSSLLTEDFNHAIKTIIDCKGKLIITGMGKSGIIGKKIAATLASTGTPSFHIHPGEAYHGDLGMIEPEDVVLLISNSGETDEVLKLIPFLNHQKNKTISMTGNRESTLAKNTHFHLNIHVNEEACPLQLAPTSSTTATLVMGDAIAVALMKLKKFEKLNFAKFHPGGSLGKRLLQTVENVMQKTNLPFAKTSSKIMDVIEVMTMGKCGLAIIKNNSNEIVGVISDGDIRRSMKKNNDSFFNLLAEDLMTKKPKTISFDEKLTYASDMMTKNKINSLIVVDNSNSCVGIVQFYDLGI